MASGHVNRTYRPNTWLHRPSLRREDFSCQPGAVHTWHETDMLQRSVHVCYQGKNGPTSDAPQGPLMTHSGSQASHFAVTHSNSSANDVVGYVLQRGLGRP
jgi:hypothetical protein